MSDDASTQDSFLNAIRSLIESAEAQDKHFVGYTKAVVDLAGKLAVTLSLSKQERQQLRMAALLHDIGRTGLRPDVLNKEEALSPSEQEHVKSHILLSDTIVGRVVHDPEILSLIRHHHEWYNGKGYPDKLCGEAIPLGARILAVADAFVAMTQTRPYRPARSPQEACRVVHQEAGEQFCPKVAEALAKVMAHDSPLPRDHEPGAPESAVAPAPADGDTRKPAEITGARERTIADRELEHRIKSVVELRALPDIVADVMAMTSDIEACDFAKLITRIECDHALSTKMLRLANSALYVTAGKIESIDRAVVKIGVDAIRQLVLGVVIIDQWRESGGADHIHRDAFWQHSMGTALLACHIAKATGCCDNQTAFTAGLLHDLGQLILQEALGKDYGSVLEEARSLKRFLPEVEEKRLGTDHASIMRTVGRDWGLPRHLTEVMAQHHQPWTQVQVVAPDVLPLLLCVRIGNSFSHALGLSDASLGSLEVVPKMLLRFLGLQKDGFEELLQGTAREVSELAQLYGFSSKTTDRRGTPDRSRRQRPGLYVCEEDAELDPIWCYLRSEAAPIRLVSGVEQWLNASESSWCWVRAATPGFVQKILSTLKSIPDAARIRRDLLLLLPEAAQGGLQQELSQTGLPFLVEPWSTAALCDVLSRMGAVRAESEALAAPSSGPACGL